MDYVYRITRTDTASRPRGTGGRQQPHTEVRYGTKRRAAAIAREVKQANARLPRLREHYPNMTFVPVVLKVERSEAPQFEDVTAEFVTEEPPDDDGGDGAGVREPGRTGPDPSGATAARLPGDDRGHEPGNGDGDGARPRLIDWAQLTEWPHLPPNITADLVWSGDIKTLAA